MKRSNPVLNAFALYAVFLLSSASVQGTPANKAGFGRYYGAYLGKGVSSCTACHLPSANKNPESLDEFPHNPFGDRLRKAKKELSEDKAGDFSARLAAIAKEDSDQDGVPNEAELLLGHAPGNDKDKPTAQELSSLKARQKEFAKFLASYQWRPFEPVKQPKVPGNKRWARNEIDRFVAAKQVEHKLSPRPEAAKEILLRRVYFDLIGLSPTPAEVEAFVRDSSSKAYEKVVERLLNDPRHGERWARHWMDVWRYSDWAGWTEGKQVRDSQPHIWRWRDWIVESLNTDKGYDKMMEEMLAADELAPDDTNALRATGFLARNYKMLSREQWMEDTLKHTGQAFLGLTIGCAKCHDHMTDPISQREYYRLRAIFEPHRVRIDRVPGETNTAVDGLARVYDTDTNSPTYLFVRGDERRADTNTVLTPNLPRLFRASFEVQPVSLPHYAANPDKREHVIRDTIAASEKAVAEARTALEKAQTEKKAGAELKLSIEETRHESLLAVLAAEKLEDKKDTPEWEVAARKATAAQRTLAVLEARLKLREAERAKNKVAEKKETPEKTKELEEAEKKRVEAEKSLATAEKESQAELTTKYQPRPVDKYPATSTGRRLAFARWLSSAQNPLTARVAVNQVWTRHFGRGLVPTVSDFGTGGKPPSHPELLDWLAAEFMEHGWSMKHLHRLIVMSSTYRMASTTDKASAAIDPDNTFLWRMNSRRLEAEAVRDNLFYVAGNLDATMGGPDIDHALALKSKRRSVYLRCAQEKQPEFLKIFDGPSVVECYERRPTVMPQQALALINSELALAQAKVLARKLDEQSRDDEDFIQRAFWQVLARRPKANELKTCQEFLAARPKTDVVSGADVESPEPVARSRENLVLVLFNHNDFVTVR